MELRGFARRTAPLSPAKGSPRCSSSSHRTSSNFLLDAGVYLVVNMQRTWSTPPKTDTRATTAGVATTPIAAPALLSNGGLFSSDEYPEDASVMDKILREIGVLLQTESFRCSRNEKEIGETDTHVRDLMQHLAIGREEGRALAEAEALQAEALLLQLEEARKETRLIQQQVSGIRNPKPETRNPKPEIFRLCT